MPACLPACLPGWGGSFHLAGVRGRRAPRRSRGAGLDVCGLHAGPGAGGWRTLPTPRGQLGPGTCLWAELVETPLGFFHTDPTSLLPTERHGPSLPTSWKWEEMVLQGLSLLPASLCHTGAAGRILVGPARTLAAAAGCWDPSCTGGQGRPAGSPAEASSSLAGGGLGLTTDGRHVGAGSAGTAPGSLGGGRGSAARPGASGPAAPCTQARRPPPACLLCFLPGG